MICAATHFARWIVLSNLCDRTVSKCALLCFYGIDQSLKSLCLNVLLVVVVVRVAFLCSWRRYNSIMKGFLCVRECSNNNNVNAEMSSLHVRCVANKKRNFCQNKHTHTHTNKWIHNTCMTFENTQHTLKHIERYVNKWTLPNLFYRLLFRII